METTVRATDIVMIVAVVLGPILAVQAQAFVERRRNGRERQMQIFRTLMATRARKAAEPSHVEALNLISIEFHKVKSVRDAWNLYIDHLNSSGPANEIWGTKMNDLFIDLLHQMARSVGYDFDKVQISRQGYTPKLYETREKDEAVIREGVISVLTGKASLPIHNGGQAYVASDVPNPMAAIPARPVNETQDK